MNRALFHAAVLAVPLLGLAGLWLNTDRAGRQGTEWDVPIQGYDPRDLLQGHYVEFRYDWPSFDPKPDQSGYGFDGLCLIGAPPVLERVEVDAKPCTALIRKEDQHGGRLYASQAEALRLQKELWDQRQQGVVRIRLRPDGRAIPLGITFRPRPPEPQAAP